MRLEPVYLVAPLPAPKTMPTRRALLIAGAAFAGGTAAGWFGAQLAPAPATPPADPIVVWAREASRAGRIGELRAHYHGLLHALATAPDDAELWHAVRQLVDDLETRSANDDAPLIATSLRQTLAAYPGACPDEAAVLSRLRALEKR